MDAEADSEDSPEDAEAERLAAMLLDLPADSGCDASGNNNKTVANLLEFTALIGLFNKLHLAGLQQRALPPEFTPSCISSILLTLKPVLCSEPSCLQIASPVVLFGDIHGEFHVLTKLADILGRPPQRSFMFLGDYVDRGPHSLEALLYLLLLKSIHPKHVFVLRGNHEDRRVYRFFNFEDDLVRLFGLAQGQNLSSLFHTVLCYLPVCAILNGEIFCCHGGLSPQFNHPRFASGQDDLVKRINQLPKPVLFRRSDFVADLLWSDPLDFGGSRLPNLQASAYSVEEWLDKRLLALSGRMSVHRRSTESKSSEKVDADAKSPSNTTIAWMPNPRGCSYVFGKPAFLEFSRRYRINWLVRGHMYITKGVCESFDGRCITLFTAADYAQKFHNIGAVIAIDARSNGRNFPGRVLRFGKQPLLRFSGQLPPDSAKWPLDIVGPGKH